MGFILPWWALSGGRYGEPVLRRSGVTVRVSLGWTDSGGSESFWAKLAGSAQTIAASRIPPWQR